MGVDARGRYLVSRPTRARGLKLTVYPGAGADEVVAPYAGAWIETCDEARHARAGRRSRPTRARGLKHLREIHGDAMPSGRALRGRVD